MLTIPLHQQGKIPLYEQLYKYIRREIESGRIAADERLPSKRALAAHLKISTATVETAYEQLVAEGYLRAEAKRGFFAEPLQAPAPPAAAPRPLPAEETGPAYAFDFQTNRVDTALFPFATWAKLGREVLSRRSGSLLTLTHPQGNPGLRREIARYLYDYRGIRTRPEQIVVGAGNQYLLGLLVQLLGREKRYGVENPGYRRAAATLAANGADIRPIGLDAAGLSLKELRGAKAEIAHVTPSHQFPSGIVMPVSRRLQLLHWAAECGGRYIIEDDYDSEFRFSGQPIPALQGLDSADKVIYLNAFSKSLAPSLRIGYMVLPPPLLEKYRRELLFYSCTISAFEQNTLELFMARGHFERHLRRMRTVYKERRDCFMEAVKQSAFGPQTRFLAYNEGPHLLMEVDNGKSEAELVRAAGDQSVHLRGLSQYYHPPAPPPRIPTLVAGYAALTLPDIAAAVRRLEQAWEE